MCHKPIPIAVAEVIVGVIAGVTCEVVLWTDNQGPLAVLDKGGG